MTRGCDPSRVSILETIETYYDTAPRGNAEAEAHGPFTLFQKAGPDGWDYYVRPRLGLTHDVTREDVDAARARRRELGATESFEWVHETTPSLLAAVRASGLAVERCPLLVLDAPVRAVAEGVDIRMLSPDDDLSPVVAAVHAGFDGTDEVRPQASERQARLMRAGLLALAGAYDAQRVVLGGGSHGPRGRTTELTGIAVLPRARRRGIGAAITAALVDDAHSRGVTTVFLSAQDDAVARVYERVGFVRVGTACIARLA